MIKLMGRKPLLTIMFDNTHGNLLTFEDSDLLEFRRYVESLGFQILENNLDFSTMQEINLTKILVIGVPTKKYTKTEINNVIDYVRNGGSLLLIQSHGGDYLQNTNLNSLAMNFGMKFENIILKSAINAGVPTTPIIPVTNKHALTKGIRKIVLGGGCCISVTKNVEVLLETSSDCVFETYDPDLSKWVLLDPVQTARPVAAINNYGLGKVAALCSLEILSSNQQFGLDSLDNKKFIASIITWLGSMSSDEEVKFWMLDQIGTLYTRMEAIESQIGDLLNAIRELNNKIDNLQ